AKIQIPPGRGFKPLLFRDVRFGTRRRLRSSASVQGHLQPELGDSRFCGRELRFDDVFRASGGWLAERQLRAAQDHAHLHVRHWRWLSRDEFHRCSNRGGFWRGGHVAVLAFRERGKWRRLCDAAVDQAQAYRADCGYRRRVRKCGRRALPDLLLVRDAAHILSCCFCHGVCRLGTDLYVRRESEGTHRRRNARRHGDHDRGSLIAMLAGTTSEIAISVGQHSIAGRKSRNDDSYGVLLPQKSLLATKGIAMAIADGMSSSEAAKEASETCVRSFLDDYFATHPSWTVKTSVERVLTAANRWMHSHIERLTNDHRVRVSRQQDYLSRAFGIERDLAVDYRKRPVERGDVLVFTT